jgi:hypothetical protein
MDFLLEGREGTTDAMVSMQRELLDAYEQASRVPGLRAEV